MQVPARVGLLSGTFDPIHNLHLAIALAARDKLDLDEVWILVNAMPAYAANPLTAGKQPRASFAHRRAMARLAARAIPGVETDRVPLQEEEVQHNLDTARRLAAGYPDTRFTLIMGDDVYSGIGHWQGVDELRRLLDFAVAKRTTGVSSGAIRAAIASGRPPQGLPPAVHAYIKRHRLYSP